MTKLSSSAASPVAHLIGPGSLKIHTGQLAYSTGKPPLIRLDPRALQSVFCYGAVGLTGEASQRICTEKIHLAWFDRHGSKYLGGLFTPSDPHVALRLAQHCAFSDTPFRLALAKQLVRDKLDSQIHAARHYQRQGNAFSGEALRRLKEQADQVEFAGTLSTLRGQEGAASVEWFRLFAALLPSPWEFPRRARRPPPDPINALLSLGYMLLFSRMQAQAAAWGLETHIGVLHEFRSGRASLACDLMDPFRVLAVDRWVLYLCHQGMVSQQDFEHTVSGVRLVPSRFAQILGHWEEHYQNHQLQKLIDQSLSQFIGQIRSQLPSTNVRDPDEMW